MPYDIQTGRNTFQPTSFALSNTTLMLMANGLNSVMKWSGVPNAAVKAGTPAPEDAIPFGYYNASSSGYFRGGYVAYYRFINNDGQPGNLSPLVSQEFSAGTYPAALHYRNATDGEPLFPWVSDDRIDKVQIYRSTSNQSLEVYLEEEWKYPHHESPDPPTTKLSVTTSSTGPSSAGDYYYFFERRVYQRLNWYDPQPTLVGQYRSPVVGPTASTGTQSIKWSIPTGAATPYSTQLYLYRTKANGNRFYLDAVVTVPSLFVSPLEYYSGTPDGDLTNATFVFWNVAPTVTPSTSAGSVEAGLRKFYYDMCDGTDVLVRSLAVDAVARTASFGAVANIDYDAVLTSSDITPAPSGVDNRKIYRTRVNDSQYPTPQFWLDTTQADDTTENNIITTNTDASLVSLAAPGVPIQQTLSAPTITFGSASASTAATYYFFYTHVDDNGRESMPSPITSAAASAADYFSYSNVAVGGSGVTARRIYRAKAGTLSPFYLDVTIPNNTDTTTTSANPDSVLVQQWEIRGSNPTLYSTVEDSDMRTRDNLHVVHPDRASVADRFGEPPNFLSVVVGHQDRIWLAVPVDYDEGHAEVTLGSDSVQGRGTRFTAEMVNRYFYVQDHPEAYTITAVNVATQVLTIQGLDTTSPYYSGPTDLFAPYSIQAPPAWKNSIQPSGNGEPEGFDALSVVTLQDDADQITGLMPFTPYLYVLKKRHMYQLVYTQAPGIDGEVVPAVTRGCINQRCWVKAHGVAYLMDYQGIYRFQGGQDDPVSQPIQNLFRTLINWDSSKWFHGANFPSEDTVRFFVALGATKLPRHALCFNYRHEAWWIEEYPWSIGASTLADHSDPRLLYGSEFARILTPDQTLDGAEGGSELRAQLPGTNISPLKVRIAPTSYVGTSPDWSGILHAPFSFVSGTGRSQTRRIAKVESSGGNLDLTFLTPLSVLPDATSKYQIGGVGWRWETGILRLADVPQGRPPEENLLAVTYEPTTFDSHLEFLAYVNHQRTPLTRTSSQQVLPGVRFIAGRPEVEVDTDQDSDGNFPASVVGYRKLSWAMGEGFDHSAQADRFVKIGLQGVQGTDRTTVYDVTGLGAM